MASESSRPAEAAVRPQSKTVHLAVHLWLMLFLAPLLPALGLAMAPGETPHSPTLPRADMPAVQ